MIILICTLIIVIGSLIIFSIRLNYKAISLYEFNESVAPIELRVIKKISFGAFSSGKAKNIFGVAYVLEKRYNTLSEQKWKKLFTFTSFEAATKYLKKEEERISKGTSFLIKKG